MSKTVGEANNTNNVTTYHIWDGTNIVAEANSSNAITKSYVRGHQLLTDSSRYAYMYDGHGNLVQQNSGTTNKSFTRYDAFGNVTDSTGNNSSPFGYCGEYTDAETGLIYLRNRYYDTTTGSFITEDPAKDGSNWYAYCAGNPVEFWDPLGLEYNRELAVKYAQIYGKTRNSNYDNYESNCANFVSQCLNSGGISQNDEWYSKAKGSFGKGLNRLLVTSKNTIKDCMNKFISGDDKKEKTSYEMRNSSATWTLAKVQYNYFSNLQNGYTSGDPIPIDAEYQLDGQLKKQLVEPPIQPGDLLYWGNASTGEIEHASIITEIKNNDIYFAGNTSDRDGGPEDSVRQVIDWNKNYLIIVRIKDDAK